MWILTNFYITKIHAKAQWCRMVTYEVKMFWSLNNSQPKVFLSSFLKDLPFNAKMLNLPPPPRSGFLMAAGRWCYGCLLPPPPPFSASDRWNLKQIPKTYEKTRSGTRTSFCTCKYVSIHIWFIALYYSQQINHSTFTDLSLTMYKLVLYTFL